MAKLSTYRKRFNSWKRSKEFYSVYSTLLRESRYLCNKCLKPLNLSTTDVSHIVSIKTLEEYGAIELVNNISNLTVHCSKCNRSNSSATEYTLLNPRLLELCSKYNIPLPPYISNAVS